ncbi:hypothetical protein [Roseibium suaedae]|uniref:Transposase n=1 Tax=Roseibium suaedae TaxID=735517 RepID=A0A1M7NL44_9HYPH|nr:hypothetical protein [Roseibium suaedae]SHN04456.1 hypothetical protein SAMN05444272_3822 [Roseibium suaedae]
MKQSKFSDAQITFILRQTAKVHPLRTCTARQGIRDATFCNWANAMAG